MVEEQVPLKTKPSLSELYRKWEKSLSLEKEILKNIQKYLDATEIADIKEKMERKTRILMRKKELGLDFMTESGSLTASRKLFFFPNSKPKTYKHDVDQFYKNIVDKITVTNIIALERIFWLNDYVLSHRSLITAIKNLKPKCRATKKDVINLCIKVDKDSQGIVTWKRLLLILYNEIQKVISLRFKDYSTDMFPPFKDKIKIIETAKPGTIIAIDYFPLIKQWNESTYTNGMYITANKRANITFWDLNMKHIKTEKLTFKYSHSIKPVITQIKALPDFDMMVFGSTDSALRFYGITTETLLMKLTISHFPQIIVRLYYNFSLTRETQSVLVAGLANGTAVIFCIYSFIGGPLVFKRFQYALDNNLLYEEVLHGALPNFKVIELANLHHEGLSQIELLPKLDVLITSSNEKKKSLVFTKFSNTEDKTVINVSGGVQCFHVIEERRLVITGGNDTLIRLWSIDNPLSPITTFVGHTNAIVFITSLYNGRRIYSVSSSKSIRVWDINTGECIMTLTKRIEEIGKLYAFQICYNPQYRTLLLGQLKIAIIKLGFSINYDMTDGITHIRAVSLALYNPVFEMLVTLGMDSRISFWKALSGDLILSIPNAHPKTSYLDDDKVFNGITAGTFNSKWSYLLTGAVDGTVKQWDVHSGSCVKHFLFEKNCPVTYLLWKQDIILATGWSKVVKVWNSFSEDYETPMKWHQFHTEDITVACFCASNKLITSTFNGELAFSNIKVREPFKMYFVISPSFEIQYKFNELDEYVFGYKKIEHFLLLFSEKVFLSTNRCNYCVSQHGPDRLGVTSLLSLDGRPCRPDVGTIIVALESGWIQIWSHHIKGGILDEFYPVHDSNDYVLSMATDCPNKYLFTGFLSGYVKVWHIENYVYPKQPEEITKICWPLMRLKFPLLIPSSKFLGRAQRAMKNRQGPLLLSSYRAHLKAVSSLNLIQSWDVLVTSSHDFTVRYWTYGGIYMGTLGAQKKIRKLRRNPELHIKYTRIPPDIKRVASSTTLHVFNNAYAVVFDKKFVEELELFRMKQKLDSMDQVEIYPDYLTKPILGNYYLEEILLKTIDTPEDLSKLPTEGMLAELDTYPLNPLPKAKQPPGLMNNICNPELMDVASWKQKIQEGLNYDI